MLGRLHVITDTRPGRDPLAVADAALDAGAPVIQVRGKDLTDRELYDLAARVADRCHRAGALCLVNDRPDIAVAVGADGAHVGEHDLPVGAARRVLGDGAVLGATARDPATAVALAGGGATYLGVGPCFATTTKAGLPAPLGVEGLAAVAAAVAVPVIAIAGVSVARVPDLLAAGAHGVAVVGAVSRSDDPRAAVAALLRSIDAVPVG